MARIVVTVINLSAPFAGKSSMLVLQKQSIVAIAVLTMRILLSGSSVKN